MRRIADLGGGVDVGLGIDRLRLEHHAEDVTFLVGLEQWALI